MNSHSKMHTQDPDHPHMSPNTTVSRLKALLLVLQSLGFTFGGIGIGFFLHTLWWISTRVWRAVRHPTRLIPRRKIQWLSPATDPVQPLGSKEHPYKVVVVGCGFSGLCAIISLLKLGQQEFICLERRDDVGGTWHDNVYPGCACDVPSNLYSFSFAPNPNWNYFFGRQPEIRAYLEGVARKYGARPYIRFNTTVKESRWDNERQLWAITYEGAKQPIYTQYIINAQGALSNPQLPKIPGIDKFKGRMMHSAKWDHTYDFENKKVACVGTGASSIQLVPEVAKVKGIDLTVFQRTAPWVVPRMDRRVTSVEKALFRMFPLAQQGFRALVYWAREIVVLNFVFRWPTRWINIGLVNFVLRQQIDSKKHPELLKKVMPSWELGCKRVLISNDWYPALQLPNVHLEDDSIAEITEDSIITKQGHKHQVDAIIWSTGFQVQPQAQRLPIAVYGKNGLLLDDFWKETVQAYKGITIPEFPNLFFMLGPNTGLAHNSIILMLESQCNYIMEGLKYMDRTKQAVFEIKPEVCTEWNQDIQQKLKKTVWSTGGCKSWYLDKKGNNTTLYPGFTFAYRFETENFDSGSYRFQQFKNPIVGKQKHM